MRTFRNILFHLHRQVCAEWIGLRNVEVLIRESIWLENNLNQLEGKESDQGHPLSYWLRLFSSQTFPRIKTPTFLKPSHSAPTCLWRWKRQSDPKLRHIKFRRRGITQKKAHNIQNTAKVWNQESNVVVGTNSWNITLLSTKYFIWKITAGLTKCRLIYSCCIFVAVRERQIKTLNSVLKRDILFCLSVVL